MCLNSIHPVALIRTLVLDPDILLLDEPFGVLDAQTKLMINDDIYDMVTKENKSVMMVTMISLKQ